MSNLYVLEWSRSTGETRVQSLDETLSANRKAYRENSPTDDFIPLVVEVMAVILDTAELIKPTLIGRKP